MERNHIKKLPTELCTSKKEKLASGNSANNGMKKLAV